MYFFHEFMGKYGSKYRFDQEEIAKAMFVQTTLHGSFDVGATQTFDPGT